jgi:hypothetical protein
MFPVLLAHEDLPRLFMLMEHWEHASHLACLFSCRAPIRERQEKNFEKKHAMLSVNSISF